MKNFSTDKLCFVGADWAGRGPSANSVPFYQDVSMEPVKDLWSVAVSLGGLAYSVTHVSSLRI